jgi:ubiquinone/menaquinone biosynthesis C-methylase UbiE
VGRALRFTLAIAVVGAGVLGARAWLAERRARNVFPASQAAMILNPLRRLVMPVGKALDRFGISEGATVLELGPGPGYYSIEASKRAGTDGRLICLDLQREMLDILRGRLEEADCSAELIVGDATKLPLRDGAVDATFLVTVLGEVPDQTAAMEELGRVTRAGGTVSFAESFGDPDYVLAKEMRRMAAGAGLREESFYRDALGYTMVFRR